MPGTSSLDDCQDVVLLHDEILFALELHLGARILAEEDLIALLHLHGDELALLGSAAFADGDDLGEFV